jgi:hypothetical protein
MANWCIGGYWFTLAQLLHPQQLVRHAQGFPMSFFLSTESSKSPLHHAMFFGQFCVVTKVAMIH